MDACPKCEGLLIEDFDDENFSATQEPIGYYCPGCGWSSDDGDLAEDETDEDADPWMCHCGHYEESGFHCSHCGNQPPWGCDCLGCSEPEGEELEEWEYPEY